MSQKPEINDPIKRLKEATSDQHEDLEQQLGAQYFGSDSITRKRYEEILASMYGLYEPLEQRLEPAIREHLTTFSYQSRSDRIASDLRVLGWTDQERANLPRISSTSLLSLRDPFQTLGCLYVVEGSELGSSVIRRRFEEMLDDETLRANSFYRDNPEETRSQWNNFRALFNQRVRDDHELTRTISSARDTFDLYRRWLS
jgi:heme oxygenase